MTQGTVYVASSWRNTRYPAVVEALCKQGWNVYDFRNPPSGESGFSWSSIDPAWQQWTPEQYLQGLQHPLAQSGFQQDMAALKDAEIVVMVLPCGKSAHLELGYAGGCGKRTYILMEENQEPELMYKMATRVCTSLDQLLEYTSK